MHAAAKLSALGAAQLEEERGRSPTRRLRFHPVTDVALKATFDSACELLHYAGACHRVGRRLRLAAMMDERWVGGVVLGSPFPNIRPRDDAFNISRFAGNLSERGLPNAWCRENREYWEVL